MQRINYKDDFTLELTPDKEWAGDFTLSFSTATGAPYGAAYVCSRVGGAYTNCRMEEDGKLLCVFDGHGLQPGRLLMRARYEIADSSYPDGVRTIERTTATSVTLVPYGESGTREAEESVVMPYAVVTAYEMAVAAGYGGTEAEWLRMISGGGVEVVQETGESAAAVMSQRATTEALRGITELRGQLAVLTLEGGGTVLAGTQEAVARTVRARSNVTPDSLVILQGDTEIAGGTEAECTATVTLTPADMASPGTVRVEARATYGSATRRGTVEYAIVKPVYVGAGASASEVMVDGNRQTARTTPSGTYTVAAKEGDYVWIIVPMGTNGMVVGKATLSGFDFPLEAADTTTVEGYRAYRSRSTYKAGTLSIVVTGSRE